jgi:hypothetical protein
LSASAQEGEDPLLEQPAPKLGASVKTECVMLMVDGFLTNVDPKLDRSFLLFWLFRESTRDGTMVMGSWIEGTAGH